MLFIAGIGLGLLEERLSHRFAVPYAFLIMLALILAWFAYSLTGVGSGSDQLMFPGVIGIWLLCGILVFVSVFGVSKEGAFEAMAERFGDASYSVYLFHTFILSALLRLKVQDINPVLFVVAALVAANAFGLFTYALVEKPILKTLRSALTKGRVERVAAPV